jgi:hypothetical protein
MCELSSESAAFSLQEQYRLSLRTQLATSCEVMLNHFSPAGDSWNGQSQSPITKNHPLAGGFFLPKNVLSCTMCELQVGAAIKKV